MLLDSHECAFDSFSSSSPLSPPSPNSPYLAVLLQSPEAPPPFPIPHALRERTNNTHPSSPQRIGPRPLVSQACGPVEKGREQEPRKREKLSSLKPVYPRHQTDKSILKQKARSIRLEQSQGGKKRRGKYPLHRLGRLPPVPTSFSILPYSPLHPIRHHQQNQHYLAPADPDRHLLLRDPTRHRESLSSLFF